MLLAQSPLRHWLRQSSRLVPHAPVALMPPVPGNFPSGPVPLADAGRLILGGYSKSSVSPSSNQPC